MAQAIMRKTTKSNSASRRQPLAINPLIGHKGEATDNREIAGNAAAVIALFTGLLCKEDPFEFIGRDGEYGMYLVLNCAHDAMKYLAEGGQPD